MPSGSVCHCTSLLALGPLGFPPCPLFGSYLGRHLAQLLRDMARIIGRGDELGRLEVFLGLREAVEVPRW